MFQIYKILVLQGVSYDCMGDCELNLKVGDKVIIKCDRYLEVATITQCKQDEPFESIEEYEARKNTHNKGRHIEGQHLPEILRVVNKEDAKQIADNESYLDDVYAKTIAQIHAHNLDMKLITAHYSFDKKVLLFQFSAEGRVDFRELLRDMSAQFRVRVELRQVGVRDEAAICGGVGTCGRPFCCATFLHSINSVNVKMAKLQGLSLNPQNISGCCGRLKCCLQYESDEYAREARENKLQNVSENPANEMEKSNGEENILKNNNQERGQARQNNRQMHSNPRSNGKESKNARSDDKTANQSRKFGKKHERGAEAGNKRENAPILPESKHN